VVYLGRYPGVYGSYQTCHEQVTGYQKNCYKGFKTREEAEDDYSKFILKEKSNHEVAKGAGQIGLSGLKNLIIFVQFVVIVVLLLSCDRM
jgi:viroplasmin and RNaseH domain-containing protein